jgi:tetratricopeptide (TPR) repeat protein
VAPIFGRERELGLLFDAFARTEQGQGQIVFVAGDAGIGKSRLLAEFRRRLGPRPHRWVEGRCASYGTRTPFLPVIDGLRRRLEIDDADDEAGATAKITREVERLGPDLRWTLPFVQQVLSLQVGDDAVRGLDSASRRSEIFRALRALMLRAAEQEPLVLAIEDLHWIDPASEEFLSFVGEAIPGGAGADRALAPPRLHALLRRPQLSPAHHPGAALGRRQRGDDRLDPRHRAANVGEPVGREQRRRLYERLGRAYFYLSDYAESGAAFEQAAAHAPGAAGASFHLAEAALSHFWAHGYEASQRCADAALEAARGGGAPGGEAMAIGVQGFRRGVLEGDVAALSRSAAAIRTTRPKRSRCTSWRWSRNGPATTPAPPTSPSGRWRSGAGCAAPI